MFEGLLGGVLGNMAITTQLTSNQMVKALGYTNSYYRQFVSPYMQSPYTTWYTTTDPSLMSAPAKGQKEEKHVRKEIQGWKKGDKFTWNGGEVQNKDILPHLLRDSVYTVCDTGTSLDHGSDYVQFELPGVGKRWLLVGEITKVGEEVRNVSVVRENKFKIGDRFKWSGKDNSAGATVSKDVVYKVTGIYDVSPNYGASVFYTTKNGTRNYIYEKDIVLVDERGETVDSFKNYLKKHDDMIYTILLVAVIDHVFLGGALKDKLKGVLGGFMESTKLVKGASGGEK